MSFVPALAEAALNISKKLGKNIFNPEFKTAFIGGANVSQYLVEEYSKLGVNLYPGLGMTEASCMVLGNTKQLEKPNSVGIPYPNEEIKIVNGFQQIRSYPGKISYSLTPYSLRTLMFFTSTSVFKEETLIIIYSIIILYIIIKYKYL